MNLREIVRRRVDRGIRVDTCPDNWRCRKCGAVTAAATGAAGAAAYAMHDNGEIVLVAVLTLALVFGSLAAAALMED